ARRARRRAGAAARGPLPRRLVPPGVDRRYAGTRAVPRSGAGGEECPGIASGPGVGEPMGSPRAPSFTPRQGPRSLGPPPGEAPLGPTAAATFPTESRRASMSGHSKWSSIKHKKGAADAKRGKLFSKLSRAIIVAAKEGGSDPAGNLALQNAIEKARS